jgi:hypothetical protein
MTGVTGLNRQLVLEVKLEGEDWFEPALNIHTPLYPSLTQFLYLLLFKSVAKKLFVGIKNIGGAFPPTLTPHLRLCLMRRIKRHILFLVNPTYIYILAPSCNKRF